MHSTSSDVQEYFWASLGKTIFNVQLVNFTPFFSPISIQEAYSCCTFSIFFPKDLFLQQEETQVWSSPTFKG